MFFNGYRVINFWAFDPIKPELPAEMVDEEYLNFDELFGFENPWVLLGNVDRTNIIFLSIFMIIGIPANFLIIIISAWSSFTFFWKYVQVFTQA